VAHAAPNRGQEIEAMVRKVDDTRHHPPDDFKRYVRPVDYLCATGGWLLMQAAAEAAELKPGQPFGQFFHAVIITGEHFTCYFDPSKPPEEIDQAKAELVKQSASLKYWSMVESTQVGNEGDPGSFSDALLVRMWIRVDARMLDIVQRYRPAGTGAFRLTGPVEIFLGDEHVSDDVHKDLRVFVKRGVRNHPDHERWALWQEQ
jgi:hypothetical protein